jgi:twitching motility protein PilI
MTAVEEFSLLCPAEVAATEMPEGQLMTPLQALTAGFDLEVVSDAARTPLERVREGGKSYSAPEQFRQGFRLGDLRLMIRFEDGSELTEMPDLYRLPNVPDWFCGMANLHGMLTPVFDLARYLGIQRDASGKRMLLILSHGADAAGVLIDGLPERLRWTEKERTDTSTAPERLAPLLRGACLAEDRLWFDLDVVLLLNVLEQALEASS